MRILVVEARFYDDIADALLAGATRVLDEAGATLGPHHRARVAGNPGCHRDCDRCGGAQRARPYDGAVALGCVIRGDTIHFDIVAMQSARALMDLAVRERLPLGNGILTVDNDAQAWTRARVGGGRQRRRRRAGRAHNGAAQTQLGR